MVTIPVNQVANLVCSMSGNEDGVKMVRYAAGSDWKLVPASN